MPRAKYDSSSPYNFAVSSIGCFKKSIPDFIYDFNIIYPKLYNFFASAGYETEAVKSFSAYEIIKNVKAKPEHGNRIYIVTGMNNPVLAVVDMDCAVVDNLIDSFDFLSDFEEYTPEACLLSYYSTLYVFVGNELKLEHNLSPFKVAQLMAVFKNENFVSYVGARDSYYGAPRRKAKSNQRL